MPLTKPPEKWTGAFGAMHLLAEYGEEEKLLRSVRLEAATDTRCVVLMDRDLRKPGIQREIRYEITPAELIALIRAHGAELPGENHVRPADPR
ncbi:hypothetical protein [Caballeronia sordidicola]|uniref:ATPases involved in chromosome partitioning n=1 Tax=Caballeronia sordidicola TaxID=196367 RepID=A0A242MSY9_CABSO|nr:hypothetical protein [Caballeronia sordidicola]OTP74133.1 ATPases involved in chromosome partitioning [Caballeronia sordidicola]